MFYDPDFSGPLFKRLSMTDANRGSAKIMGPMITQKNAPYFPQPPISHPRDTKITVILRDDAGPEVETILTREATIQVQDHGDGREETYLNDIPELRSRCQKHDYLIMEPSLVTPRLYRVTRVSPDSPRFEAVKAAAKGRAGLLIGGREPPVYAPADPATGISSPSNAASTQRARKRSGETIRADFSVTGEWPTFEVTFESADGHGRNTDYNIGVEHVLARLGELGASLVGTRISSANVLTRAIKDGVDPDFVPAGLELPLSLSAGPKPRDLRLAIGRAGAKVDSPEGTSGNTTRRMTLQVELPTPPLDLAAVSAWLAGAGDNQPDGGLTLLDDLPALDKAWKRWIGALATGSRPYGRKRRWLLAESVMYLQSPSDKRGEAVDVSLGIRTTGEPWTVEINAPKAAADANGTASVARDASGALFLIRQGRLRANKDSDGDILEDKFHDLSGLTPVIVAGGETPKDREWYVVAALDADDAEIRRQTGEFVHACALARSRSLGATAALPPMPSLFAGPETGGKFTRKAAAARPSMEFWKGHGEVSLALTARLDALDLVVHRPRHDAGYEVDGFVDAPTGPVLIEIKRGVSASDVYEGVGQLMLYSEMLDLKTHRRVLLLPAAPSQTLVDAASKCGIVIHRYGYEATESGVSVEFPDELIDLFADKNAGTGPAKS